MTKIAVLPTLLASTLVCLQPVVSAQAQSPRTFVSAAGSDSNPCSFALPCRHFQAAVNATTAGGEVDALDPAGYGPITITQAITIEGQGWSYIAPPDLGVAISINGPGPTNKIDIRGVSLNGVGTTGTIGIKLNSGGTLNIQDCVIRNFPAGGIAFLPISSILSELFVSNTLVSDNGGNGISMTPGGSGPSNGVLSNVEMGHNGSSGLFVNTATDAINVTVSDSVSSNNVGDGILSTSSGATAISVMVRNSTIANNGVNGLQATGMGASVLVTQSTITGNSAGWGVATNGVVSSYADNNIDGNTTVNTQPPSPLSYK